jgi:glycosyltransferase involved in cell wall biosynthesis
VDVVVRAFAEVKQLYPAARLDLVGGGPLEAQIRGLVEHLKLRDVNFAGVAPHGQIAKFYDRADIFINGSCLDNTPVSILEAFASGTPVVSTAPEGIRYLVEHERTGLLCEPGDASALANNVIRLLREPSLGSRIISNANQKCIRYSWKEVGRQWMELYKSIAPLGAGAQTLLADS